MLGGPREFFEGRQVRVIKDVTVRGQNAIGATGFIVDAWEICQEDPACCCAELASEATITVRLQGWASRRAQRSGAGAEASDDAASRTSSSQSLMGYFAPEELRSL